MIPLIQAENLSKRWGELFLFENISLTLFQGQKVALVAKNGTGKTTLLELLAQIDTPDYGKITYTNNIKIGYFEQIPHLNPVHTVIEEIFESESEDLLVIKAFEMAVSQNNQELITSLSEKMDQLQIWDFEVTIKQILQKLKITKFDKQVGNLSGGQQKRLALAKVLINKPDILILDEPTNHLDIDMIEWLEDFLKKTNITLLMVTHDRYFLDRVCNEIIEMDNNQIFRYKGNYSYFLEKREERIKSQNAEVARSKNLLRNELEWMRRMPKARGSKAKYRIDSFHKLKEKASQKYSDQSINIPISASRLGNKILEIENLTKSFGEEILIKNFSYIFSKYEKVGFIGNNGTGKTTFLNIITGLLKQDSGKINIGKTVKFGYYKQEGISFNPKERVIDAVNKIAEYIYFENGLSISSSQLLNYFLFPHETQYNYIEKLSGGEQRRLYLCTVLMQNPNFLILDEPTNDLDIMTLNVLEEYLVHFPGCTIIVSHDRFFTDKIVDHLFVFDGNGKISDFPGNYTQYREYLNSITIKQPSANSVKPKEKPKPSKKGKRKMSFNEKREFETLENEIEKLEIKKSKLEKELNSGQYGHEELHSKSLEYERIKTILDEKEIRWLELSEYDIN